jgi:hypothetical protein
VAGVEVKDASADDFGAGSTDAGAYVARTEAGEVVLTPKVAGEFTGKELPAGWTVTPCVEGGTGTFEDGMLVLDGARVGSDPVLPGPRSLEVAAVFAARPDQHAGFGTNFVDVPWVMFSTKWGRRLYGRTHLLNVEDKKLGDGWFGSRHVFRIDWNVLDVVFSIDGDRVAHVLVPVPGYMRGMAANQRRGGPPLRVEWMRISPYAPAGRFTSRVFDAGAPVEWATATWSADVPESTGLRVAVRTGETPRPDRTWARWRRLAACGGPVGATSQYVQYRAELRTADPARTPVLRRMELRYRPV